MGCGGEVLPGDEPLPRPLPDAGRGEGGSLTIRVEVTTTRATYDTVAADYADRRTDRSGVASALAGFLRCLPAGGPIVDLGCGPASDSGRLGADGRTVVGVDLSLGMLKLAAMKHPGPLAQGDAVAIPVRDETAAGVWACASLLHLPRAEMGEALRECARILAPGGMLNVHVKRGDGEGFESVAFGRPRWFTYWRDGEFDEVMSSTGLDIVDGGPAEGLWLRRLARKPTGA